MDKPKAGFLRRTLALFLDMVILDAAGVMVTYPLHAKYEVDLEGLLTSLLSGDMPDPSALMFLLLYSLLATVLWGIYFTCFIGSNGQTPGKKFLRLRVERVDGNPMDFKTAFNRFVGYSISGSFLFAGFFWALFDKNKQTWHDKMAKTFVVKISS
ncbi:MAG: RDD family protein [Nitrospinae bacterium]|nr:RDD family protein [Nitrospinota bacterium]